MLLLLGTRMRKAPPDGTRPDSPVPLNLTRLQRSNTSPGTPQALQSVWSIMEIK